MRGWRVPVPWYLAVLATVCLPAAGGAQGKVELKSEARAEINRVTDEILDSIRSVIGQMKENKAEGERRRLPELQRTLDQLSGQKRAFANTLEAARHSERAPESQEVLGNRLRSQVQRISRTTSELLALMEPLDVFLAQRRLKASIRSREVAVTSDPKTQTAQDLLGSEPFRNWVGAGSGSSAEMSRAAAEFRESAVVLQATAREIGALVTNPPAATPPAATPPSTTAPAAPSPTTPPTRGR